MTFLKVFKWYFGQYRQATAEEVFKNMVLLLNQWSIKEGEFYWPFWPSANKHIICQARNNQWRAVHLFFNGNQENRKVCKSIQKLVCMTGEMKKTWTHLKHFWRIEHLKMHRSNPMTTHYKYKQNSDKNKGKNDNVTTIFKIAQTKIRIDGKMHRTVRNSSSKLWPRRWQPHNNRW